MRQSQSQRVWQPRMEGPSDERGNLSSAAIGHLYGMVHPRRKALGMEYPIRQSHRASAQWATSGCLDDGWIKFTHRSWGCLGNLFCESLSLLVEYSSTFALLLLHLNLIFITVAVLALPISSFVELNIRCFTEELYILNTYKLQSSPMSNVIPRSSSFQS